MRGSTNARFVPNSGNIPRSGLVAEWLFENISGNQAIDTSGNNNHLTLTNCGNPSGHIGNCLYFYGNSGQSEAYSDIHIPGDNGITISFWLKPGGLPNEYTSILAATDYTDEPLFRVLIEDSISTIRAIWMGTFDAYGINIDPSQWTHFVFVNNITDWNSEVCIYVNGNLEVVDRGTDTYPLPGIYLGGDSIGGNLDYWNGYIDNIRLYKRSLTEEQILKLYNEGSA